MSEITTSRRATLVLATVKQLALAGLAIPVLVAVFSFMQGVAGYLNGTAYFLGVGYPGFEFGNLDPQYRVHRQTSGCIVLGTEFLTHLPNNAAIVLLTKVLGPMRGTYHGPYPDREEAREVLRGSRDVVALEALQSSSQQPRDCGALKALFPPRENEPVARCALFRDSTFVFGYAGRATLMARETGVAYARYRVE